MLKISLVVLVLLGLGFIAFPQLRVGLVLLAPFAPLAICIAMCPLMMYFGMRGTPETDNKPQKHE